MVFRKTLDYKRNILFMNTQNLYWTSSTLNYDEKIYIKNEQLNMLTLLYNN